MKEFKKRDELDLVNYTVIVTGSAKGIGRGIAIEMAKEGANIVIADIDTEEAFETERIVKSFGRECLILSIDVSDDQQNTFLVESTIQRFGKIDVLVNNAGIDLPGSILELSKTGANQVFTTNFVGPLFLSQKVAISMVDRQIKGSILFTSSVHGQITYLHPAYSTSKAAVEMFVREAALDLAEYGIRVNAVAPGAIKIRGETNRENLHVPLGYSGTPSDIAHTMVFLASKKANYITGQTITVDGGFSLAHTRYWIRKGIL